MEPTRLHLLLTALPNGIMQPGLPLVRAWRGMILRMFQPWLLILPAKSMQEAGLQPQVVSLPTVSHRGTDRPGLPLDRALVLLMLWSLTLPAFFMPAARSLRQEEVQLTGSPRGMAHHGLLLVPG